MASAAIKRGPVRVDHRRAARIKHPIKAATLLYSAPGYILRGPIYLVFLITVGGLVYSFIATKDVLVTAPLTLTRDPVTVQALSGGMVSEILVSQNASIRTGEPMIRVLEQTALSAETDPEQERLQGQIDDLEEQRAETMREYQFNIRDMEQQVAEAERQLTEDILRQERAISEQELALTNSLREQQDRINLAGRGEGDQAIQIQNQINQQQVARQSAARILNSAQADLGQARTDLERDRRLLEARDITLPTFQASERRVRELERAVNDALGQIQAIDVQISSLNSNIEALNREDDIALMQENMEASRVQGEARIASLQANLETTRRAGDENINRLQARLAKLRDDLGVELERIDERIAGTEQRLVEATNRIIGGRDLQDDLATYQARYDGTITNIHVNRGQVIPAGAPLVTIVRESEALEARVLVPNQSIGALEVGQIVQIKYFAYPYQEYGIPKGEIVDIATTPGGVEGFPNMYEVRVALESETIARRGRRARELEIGLEGIAEIKTGEKRLIELVFAPVGRFFEDEDSDAAAEEADGEA